MHKGGEENKNAMKILGLRWSWQYVWYWILW